MKFCTLDKERADQFEPLIDASTNFLTNEEAGIEVSPKVGIDENPMKKWLDYMKAKSNVQRREEDYLVRMLLHDFSNDPLFFDEPSFLHEVFNAQIKALKAYENGASSKSLLRNFLLDSGLNARYRTFAPSASELVSP